MDEGARLVLKAARTEGPEHVVGLDKNVADVQHFMQEA